MSGAIPVVDSIEAAGAILAARCVGFDGVQAGTAGQKVRGVAQAGTAIGNMCPIAQGGSTIVETGGAFDRGASLMTDAQGRAVLASKLSLKAGATAATSSAANGDTIFEGGDLPVHVFADAMEASSGAGKFVKILFRR